MNRTKKYKLKRKRLDIRRHEFQETQSKRNSAPMGTFHYPGAMR